ncbi:metal-dependent phosphohydrolase [Candidatus Symbiobacter mobilis CR]|uniref:Metal-dependent phosphohydrolase n=2 Tax=Candidatus Symbiobacter TaxID=1436289 RepID=U5N5P2_9BURK|nr:metal-dependent phosphohydrolase [Candidatus Symbiobacter mobilis CR]
MTLRYTLRDENGKILLIKGQTIEYPAQLQGLRTRRAIYVEIDESDEGVRAVMSGISALNLAGAPIKDFSKYLSMRKTSKHDEHSPATIVQLWSDIEAKLGVLLGSIRTPTEFVERIGVLEEQTTQLLTQNSDAALFLLFHRAVTHYGGYSALHSLLCGCLTCALSRIFLLEEEQRVSLVRAALTMNVAMTHLQDLLALQKTAPTPPQRRDIDRHPTIGKELLEAAGVTDPVWLELVATHHTAPNEPGNFGQWPVVPKLNKILQTVDRYTAAMSPRKSRIGRTARDSVRSVVVREGSSKHDEVGTALVSLLGLSPPGTFVRLSNGEIAVVLRRGGRPAEPVIASILNRSDDVIAEPRVRDTARDGLTIESTLPAHAVRVSLNPESMLRLIPRGYSQ